MISKTNKRIILCFLMAIATAYAFFVGYKKVFPTKNVDAKDDTSPTAVAAPVTTLALVDPVENPAVHNSNGMNTSTLSEEERCCRRRLSFEKHPFRALVVGPTSSCAKVVCPTPSLTMERTYNEMNDETDGTDDQKKILVQVLEGSMALRFVEQPFTPKYRLFLMMY